MTNGSAAATPAVAGNYEWLTTANLVAIAVFAILVIVAILWGARLKSRRKAADTELREDATTVSGDRRIEEASAAGAASVAPVATLSTAATPPADPEPLDPRPADPEPVDTRPVDTRPAEPRPVEPEPEPEPAPIATPAPAVAPSPPPLADTPVVATAPFDAAPATIAADLATPPAEPIEPTTAGAGDDLTRLKGVGPKLAVRLGELGITRFDQIASLSATDAEALDAQLGAFRGRLTRDRWIEQASYLARDDRAGFEAAFGKL